MVASENFEWQRGEGAWFNFGVRAIVTENNVIEIDVEQLFNHRRPDVLPKMPCEFIIL